MPCAFLNEPVHERDKHTRNKKIYGLPQGWRAYVSEVARDSIVAPFFSNTRTALFTYIVGMFAAHFFFHKE